MKPMKPKWEIYQIQTYYLVRYENDVGSERKFLATTMEEGLNFIQSFYEKRREPRGQNFKKSNSTIGRETPRHPYDRDDEWGENLEKEEAK